MTKADIIEEIVTSTGITKKDVSATVEAFMEAIKNSLLEKKENVYLRGFGSFVVKHRAKRRRVTYQKYYDRNCRARLSKFQAGKKFRK